MLLHLGKESHTSLEILDVLYALVQTQIIVKLSTPTIGFHWAA